MDLIERVEAPPVGHVRLLAVGAGRWRVLGRGGRLLGHLRADAQPGGVRYHAERFDAAAARLRTVGSFWTAAEATECLRYLR